MLKLTPWGKFVMQHTVTTPKDFWQELRARVEHEMDFGGDWEFVLAEIEHGCKELREGKLQEIICIEDEQSEYTVELMRNTEKPLNSITVNQNIDTVSGNFTGVKIDRLG